MPHLMRRLLLLLALAALASSMVGSSAAAPRRGGVSGSGQIVSVSADGVIWLDGADGSRRRRLAVGSFPSFSPDGSLIAYSGARSQGVFVIRTDGGQRRRVTGGRDFDPTWSPDGRYLAFARRSGQRAAIFLVGLDGKGLTGLTQGDVRDGQPDWSPNGALIVFARTSLAGGVAAPQLMEMGADGSGLRVLVAGSAPAFSPSGAQIAFTTTRNQVAVVNPDGGGFRVLTSGSAPTWSPDGSLLAFVRSGRDGKPRLWRVDANSGGVARIPTRAPAQDPNWQPQPVLFDWPQFGYEPGMSNDNPNDTELTASDLASLASSQVPLEGTVDSSPIYLQRVQVAGALHDVFVVQTSYGRAYAVDSDTAQILWRYGPPGIEGWEGSPEITTASPAADPDRAHVYVASPDGYVHKLSLAEGSEERSGGWPVRVLFDPSKEKISSSLAVSGRFVYAATAGLSIKIGDDTPRQGHLVAIDRASGQIAHVFYALCSNQTQLTPPSACPAQRGGIWGRAPATFEPNGNLLLAVGNGPFDGATNWGDSVLELAPELQPLQNYTPGNQDELEAADADLGSTTPALVGGHYAVQGGKDGQLRLLDLDALNAGSPVAGPHLGGELQTVQAPGGFNVPNGCEVLTQPAVWQRPGKPARIFVANDCGLAAYDLLLAPAPQLVLAWTSGRAGSSPILAGGLLYVYNVDEGGLSVYNPDPPATTAGEGFEPLLTLPIPAGHWNSPIIADGVIALGQGDGNQHQTSGLLVLYRPSSLPGSGSRP